MSADFLNIISPAKEICFQKRNRSEFTEDIVDVCGILRGLGGYGQGYNSDSFRIFMTKDKK